MTPAKDMNNDELAREYSAAHYFASASEDPEEIQRANARISEIEKEQNRRAVQGEAR